MSHTSICSSIQRASSKGVLIGSTITFSFPIPESSISDKAVPEERTILLRATEPQVSVLVEFNEG